MMKRSLTLLLAALTVFLAVPFSAPAYAAEVKVYVDEVNGNDANDGASAATAFKTLEAAITAIAQTGGTV
ncbi:MAG: hypothetical protein IJN63_07100, partial [Clostridia bacterium]|nr:hypothetical protein [Clostridia bacterium]